MSKSAAETIIIDAEVLISQESTLERTAEAVDGAAALASSKVDGSGFGSMCAFIPPAMNAMADRISQAAKETATLARRMEEGVRAGREDFAELEDEAASNFTRMEGVV